jgi:Cu/Ag efflux protein CusF
MRKSLLSAALAASFISTVAFAAAQTDSGAIRTLDTVKHQLTLADGRIFDLPASWKATGFKIGDQVKVTYEVQNGKMTASAVVHES